MWRSLEALEELELDLLVIGAGIFDADATGDASLHGQRVRITGGTEFFGSRLAPRYAAGHGREYGVKGLVSLIGIRYTAARGEPPRRSTS